MPVQVKERGFWIHTVAIYTAETHCN